MVSMNIWICMGDKEMAKNKSKKMTKNEILTKKLQFSLLDFTLKHNNEIGNEVKDVKDFVTFLQELLKARKAGWRGLVMTPPGSFLERFIASFDKYSDFPLELPFFIFLHMLSGELLQRGITLEYDKKLIHPQIWSVLIAASGGGKTTTINAIRDNFHLSSPWDATGIASHARWMQDLAENNNKLVVVDEWWAEKRKMAPGKPLEELERDMLLIRTHETVGHHSAKGVDVTIEHPCISYLGVTTEKMLENSLSIDDFYSGFCQRIRFIFAKREKDIRPARYIDLQYLVDEWRLIEKKIKYTHYRSHPRAIDAIEQAFNFFRRSYDRMDESYFKRIIDEAQPYALLYHIILGKGDNDTVDLEDYGWAGRLLGVLFSDAANFLKDNMAGDLEKKLQSVQRVYEKCMSEGRTFTAREVVRHVYAIKTVAEAKSLIAMLYSDDNNP